MLVQVGLCRTCSETTLLVFPRGGSNDDNGKIHFVKYGLRCHLRRLVCNGRPIGIMKIKILINSKAIVDLICIFRKCNSNFFLKQSLSHVMRKPTFCICKNKGADQLSSNCEANHRLCFRYTDSTIPLLSKTKISSL